MIWPKRVKVVPVSTTTSPVTHVAEVAVKKAPVHESGFTESLSALNNNTAPIIMRAPKKMIGKTRGEYENFLILIDNQYIKKTHILHALSHFNNHQGDIIFYLSTLLKVF